MLKKIVENGIEGHRMVRGRSVRWIKTIIKSILHVFRIKKKSSILSKEDQWRARGVTIGSNFDGPDSVIDYCYGHLVTIGDNVTISGTTILAHDGTTKKILGYCKVAPVKIGNNVFIGYGSIILPGVTIGNKVIVGAGTICSKDIPDNSVVVRGTDTAYRTLCTYDEYIEKQKKRMEILPISNVLFENRTEVEWSIWKKVLENSGGGFDL